MAAVALEVVAEAAILIFLFLETVELLFGQQAQAMGVGLVVVGVDLIVAPQAPQAPQALFLSLSGKG